MGKNTTSNAKNFFGQQWLWIILAAVAAVAILIGFVAFLGNRGSAAPDDGAYIDVQRLYEEKGSHAGYFAQTAPGDYETEKWRYVIRADETCDGSVFENGGQDVAGNLTEVVYDSSVYQPDVAGADLYHQKYVCFTVLAEGSWLHGGSQITVEDQDFLRIEWFLNGNYVAYIDSGLTNKEVQRWKYVTRDDETCNGAIFADNGQGAGNYSEIVYNSDTYTPPTDSDGEAVYNGNYVCFNALLSDASWAQINRRITAPDISDNTLPCPENQARNSATGVCEVPADDGDDGDADDDADEPASDLTLAETAAERFDDVEDDDLYAEAIGYLLEHGITAGCDDDSFCPDSQLTRAQFIALLHKVPGIWPGKNLASDSFEDVEAGHYADKAIGWALDVGITTGCRTEDDGRRFFCPDRAVSRAHVATFLHRSIGAPERLDADGEVVRYDFADVDEGAYYADAATWALYGGAMRVCLPGDGPPPVGFHFFCPGDLVSRGEAAGIIHQTLIHGLLDRALN